jgi:hypothetical protein
MQHVPDETHDGVDGLRSDVEELAQPLPDDFETGAQHSNPEAQHNGHIEAEHFPSVQTVISTFNDVASCHSPSGNLRESRRSLLSVLTPSSTEEADEYDLEAAVKQQEHLLQKRAICLKDAAKCPPSFRKPSESTCCSLLSSDEPNALASVVKGSSNCSTGSDDGPWWQKGGLVVTFKVRLMEDGLLRLMNLPNSCFVAVSS